MDATSVETTPHAPQETVVDENDVIMETPASTNGISQIDENDVLMTKTEDHDDFTTSGLDCTGTTSNSDVTSSTTPQLSGGDEGGGGGGGGGPMDSPCNPSSSSIDRGIDPLNLLDQEFLSSKDPREWSVQEVMDFMTAIGCPAHAPSFQKQVSIRIITAHICFFNTVPEPTKIPFSFSKRKVHFI